LQEKFSLTDGTPKYPNFGIDQAFASEEDKKKFSLQLSQFIQHCSVLDQLLVEFTEILDAKEL
jgi:hypothetical protein